MILVQQFPYIGAPHIWNGDEVGMWGADDPDQRKPRVWGDMEYEDETTHPFGLPRQPHAVAPDKGLFNTSEDLQDVVVELEPGIWTEQLDGSRVLQVDGELRLELLPLGASVWLRTGD
jgi:hypothetical protein